MERQRLFHRLRRFARLCARVAGERDEETRKEQAAERKKAAAERKKKERAERAAEEERLRQENAAMSQEVQNKVLKAKQREREERVLVHWRGRCVAVDYDPRAHHPTSECSILNTTCPARLHVGNSHARARIRADALGLASHAPTATAPTHTRRQRAAPRAACRRMGPTSRAQRASCPAVVADLPRQL
jgi:monoamine oxidase